MSSKTLGKLMRISIVAAALCGLFIFTYIIPEFGKSIIRSYPEFSSWFWPWIVFAWLIALPCFIVLILVWKVSYAVTNDTVFTFTTARRVKTGAILLLIDAVFLFVGNVILLFLKMNHPSVVILSFMGLIFLLAFAVLASVLSRYLTKASILQEESEGTI